MEKLLLILIILLLATISCENPEPQEKTYTIVLNKEEYEKQLLKQKMKLQIKTMKKQKKCFQKQKNIIKWHI